MKKSKKLVEPISDKIKEYNKLLVSQDNPERLKELRKEIDNFNFGI